MPRGRSRTERYNSSSSSLKVPYKRGKSVLSRSLSKVKQDVKVIKRALESKEITTLATPTLIKNLSATQPTTALPGYQLLNGLTQGTGSEGHVGDKVRFKYLDMKLRVSHSSTATPLWENHPFRILIVKEKCANGTDQSLLSIFGTATPACYATRNITNRDPNRFKVYYDRTFILGPYSTQAYNSATLYNGALPDIKFINIRIPLDFTTDYSRGNAGTIADIDTNSLVIHVITENTVDSGIYVSMLYNLKFDDA